MHGVLGEEFADLEPLQAEGNFTIHKRGPAFGTTFLGFNMNPGANPETGDPYLAPEKLNWFQNVQFRRAVAHSIDKDAIINGVLHGLGYAQWSSISPATGDFHNPDVRRYPYDLDEANRILDDLGWGGYRRRRHPRGRRRQPDFVHAGDQYGQYRARSGRRDNPIRG